MVPYDDSPPTRPLREAAACRLLEGLRNDKTVDRPQLDDPSSFGLYVCQSQTESSRDATVVQDQTEASSSGVVGGRANLHRCRTIRARYNFVPSSETVAVRLQRRAHYCLQSSCGSALNSPIPAVRSRCESQP